MSFRELTPGYLVSDEECPDTFAPGWDPLYVVRLNGHGEWLAICEERGTIFAHCQSAQEAIRECELDLEAERLGLYVF